MIVVTSGSEVRGTMQLYIRQLSRQGIEVCLVHPNDLECGHSHGTIGRKLAVARKYAEMFRDHDGIVFSDAFDVTFYGTLTELTAQLPSNFVLQAAEKNFHPPDHPGKERINGGGKWRYANGGLAIGTPESFLHWADMCEKHPRYEPRFIDQGFMNLCIADGYDCGWGIDWTTCLFYCLYGGYEELTFDRGRPVNQHYNTRPLFVHANGGWNSDQMFERYRRSL